MSAFAWPGGQGLRRFAPSFNAVWPDRPAHPVAPPFALGMAPPSRPVNALLAQIRDPKDAAPRSRAPEDATRPSGTDEPGPTLRISRRQLNRLSTELQPRDRAILQRLQEHGYLTTDQIQRFVFTHHRTPATAARTTRRTLQRLESQGLVASLARRQGGLLGGSAPSTWHLTPGGVRFVRGHHAVHRRRAPSLRHLLHSLAIAEAHLALIDYAQTRRDSPTGSEVPGQSPGALTVATEPSAWRTFPGVAGVRRVLKPDLAASLTGQDADGPYRDEWLLEIDLGTESHATLMRKCLTYADYYRSGAWQLTDSGAQADGIMPAVVWLFDNPARITRLRNAIQRSPKLPTELFRFATLETLPAALTGDAP